MPNPKSLKTIMASSKRAPYPAVTGPGGFTLVELLVAMAIASILLAVVASLFTTMQKSYTSQNVAANVQQVTRAGVDFMAHNIRMAGLDPNRSGVFGITDATATSIAFTADFDMDGSAAADETIGFLLIGDELRYNPGNVSLVENVVDSGLTLTYLDGNNSVLTIPPADPASIRTVRIVLTVEEPAGRGEPVARTYATEVRCRNLGL